MAIHSTCTTLFNPDYRLATFPEEWPHSSENISPRVLAENGFYFTGSDGEDEVQCFACGKVLDGWEPNDNVHEEHQRRNECFFLSFLKNGGDPRKMTLKVALKIQRCVYARKITSLENETLENTDILNTFVRNKRK